MFHPPGPILESVFLWGVSVDRNLPVYLNLSCSHLRFSQAKKYMWRATVPRHRTRLSNATAFSCAVVGGRPCALDKSSDTSAPHNPDQTSDNFKLQPHELQPRRIAQAVVLALPRFDTFSCGFCVQWVKARLLHMNLWESARALKLSAIESARPRPEAAEAGGRQAGRGRQGSRGRGAEAEAGRREEAKEGRRRGRETDDTDTQTQTSRTEPFHPLPPPMRASARPATCCDKRSHFLLKPQAIPTREPQ